MKSHRRRILVTVALFFSSLMTACGSDSQPRSSPPASQATGSPDDQLIAAAQRIPGFGGVFLDEDGDVNVYLLDADEVQRGGQSALAARVEQVREGLRAVFGESLLARRAGDPNDPERQRPPEIRILKGDYDISQLAQWRRRATQVTARGIVSIDLDERRNRVTVGIDSSADRRQVEAALLALQVPLAAVIIEEKEPVRFHATLRDKRRPVPGGVQVEADTAVFGYKTCTLGFNAIRLGRVGFVTNSHCTESRGGSEGTTFHQPDDPLFSEGNRVGDEFADPDFFTGEMCPTGKVCRFSDSAFVRYEQVSVGEALVARTLSPDGSREIDSAKPTFQITSENATPIAGTMLDKVGRTTGWARGRVEQTCADINVADTNVHLLCQGTVTRASGTNKLTDNGDSGSPVFQQVSDQISLYGILWGGNDSGTVFVFSPMGLVEQELGSLTTFDFPDPPPPVCPRGRKCCEPGPDPNTCLLCVPNNASCP